MTFKNKYKMLLCPPTYFDVVYSINPWMDVNQKIDKEKAKSQWNNLYSLLKDLSVEIFLIDSIRGLPDMTFSGDAGMVYNNKFIAGNFKHKERQPESDYYKKWFKDRKYEVIELPKHVYFEGMGDIVFYGDNAISAYGIRSTKDAVEYIRKHMPELNFMAESLKLVDPHFFHLGYSLTLLNKETIMYIPKAFSHRSNEIIESLVPNIIKITKKEDIENAAVNAIVLDKNIVVHKCSNEIRTKLSKLGFNVIECNVSEFLKAGGSVRCLVLYL